MWRRRADNEREQERERERVGALFGLLREAQVPSLSLMRLDELALRDMISTVPPSFFLLSFSPPQPSILLFFFFFFYVSQCDKHLVTKKCQEQPRGCGLLCSLVYTTLTHKLRCYLHNESLFSFFFFSCIFSLALSPRIQLHLMLLQLSNLRGIRLSFNRSDSVYNTGQVDASNRPRDFCLLPIDLVAGPSA